MIDTSYNNNIQTLTGVQAGQLERIGSALAINQASDDPSGLQIASELQLQEDSLSQSLSNVNSGIAMSNIAQSGLKQQGDILNDIHTKVLQASNGTTSQEGREAIANDIRKALDQYDQIANSTKYNSTELLKTAGDSTDDLSIVGEDSIVTMQKSDTVSISDDLRDFLDDFATDPDARNDMLNALKSGMDQNARYQSDYGSASNMLESSGRGMLSTQVETAKAKATILDIDYAKESADFNKTNLMSQISMIVQSQSNAIQSRTVPLIS